ncbi:hypothetical protein B0H14DRAFT_2567023 [Mycena olivaceomarginata]|nr:hypothetical protein B0H14DRAFT_2567023 [Mycena olivaceomarginata]
MSYQRVFKGGGVAHEVNRTKQRYFTEIQARKGAAGEGERMWREEESIDGNVTCINNDPIWISSGARWPVHAVPVAPGLRGPATGMQSRSVHFLTAVNGSTDGSKRGALPKKAHGPTPPRVQSTWRAEFYGGHLDETGDEYSVAKGQIAEDVE